MYTYYTEGELRRIIEAAEANRIPMERQQRVAELRTEVTGIIDFYGDEYTRMKRISEFGRLTIRDIKFGLTADEISRYQHLELITAWYEELQAKYKATRETIMESDTPLDIPSPTWPEFPA